MVTLTLRMAVYLIVGVAIFLLLFPFATKTYAAIPQAFTETECRASIEWRARTHIDILDFESPLPFECSTKTIFLKYDKSGRKKDEDLLSVAPTYYIPKGDNEKVKRIFAESLSKCLWQMGDGNLDVFAASERTRCIICYDIIIDKDIVDKDKGNIQILRNFDNYLESNKFSKTKEYYKNYLSEIDTVWNDLKLADDQGNPISFSVLYAASKASRQDMAKTASALTAALSVGVGCLGGGLIGFFMGGGVGVVPGLIVGCKTGVLMIPAPTATMAVIGYITDKDIIWSLGLQPLYNVSSQCQGLF